MMPRAAQRFADENSLAERRAVMGALSADGEPVRLDIDQHDWLSKRMTGDELTSTNTADRDALGQIRASQLIGLLCHFRSEEGAIRLPRLLDRNGPRHRCAVRQAVVVESTGGVEELAERSMILDRRAGAIVEGHAMRGASSSVVWVTGAGIPRP